jgi:tetratricopeptide (TPR) repeat protein
MKSAFSNEIHQLLVTVSKHLYIGKSGVLKYQEKPFTVDIASHGKSNKEHLVYYLIRDHYSGNFVFKTATTKSLIPLADFLYYAWQGEKRDDKFLWGLPLNISIPKNVTSPELLAGMEALGIKPFHPASGFASGVKTIKDLEDNIHYLLSRFAEHNVAGIERYKRMIYNHMIELKFDGNKQEKWLAKLPVNLPELPSYKKFLQCFNQKEEGVEKEPWVRLTEIGDYTFPEPTGKLSEDKLERAEDKASEGWEENSAHKQIEKAWQALKISPYCVDAYNLLAFNSSGKGEKEALYGRGLIAGKAVLGDEFMAENKGQFWDVLETRPYMRSLCGLAYCLADAGERKKAIDIFYGMLDLNPKDNQGVRYNLMNLLLEEGLDKEAWRFLKEHDEGGCFMSYSRALLNFRRSGDGMKANTSLLEAYRSNEHVPAYLTGKKFISYHVPKYYGWGDDREAQIYAKGAIKAWQNAPGAVDWLKKRAEEYAGNRP